MKVCKFGGSSLADSVQVGKVCDIVLSDPARRVVVVSAPGKRRSGDSKVTDMLITCGEAALHEVDTEPFLQAIVARYAEIQKGLGLDPAIVAEIEADLRGRIAGDKSHDGMFIDCMKAAGEDNSARLVAAALKARGADAAYMSPAAAGMLLTSEFGNARLLDEAMPRLERSLRAARGIVVFPGFFGVTREGRIATFSRGGSDITGAILAAAAGAEVYENFTDVDAVYPVDPRLVPEVHDGIVEMTYREMRELAYAGFGVFHDEAVRPAYQAGVTINIRNTNRPELPGTLVKPHRQVDTCKVVGIASDVGFAQLYVDKYMMNREVGFGRRLLRILEDESISWEHIPTGIDNMSVLFRQAQLGPDSEERILRRVRDELKPDTVSIDRGHSLVVLVGEGMRYAVGITARAAGALAEAGVNIEILNQGTSETSVTFGVKESDRAAAVRALYNAFF